MSCQSEAEWLIGKLKDNDDISLNIEKLKRNDTIGDPELFESKEYGLISANTVRYINSLQNIQKHIHIPANEIIRTRSYYLR